MALILFVDDEAGARQNYAAILKHYGYDVTLAASAAEARTALNSATAFDLVVTDMRLGAENGLAVLSQAKQLHPELDVIVLTGHGEIANAIEAIRLGASDYLTKDTDYKEILLVVEKVLEKRGLKREIERLRERLQSEYSFERIIGRSAAITEIVHLITRVARTDSRVLITGESGTGKELVAESLHMNSDRKNAPFIAINCGAIAEHLQESELFGYVKGAFTGAVNDKRGLLEAADRGTLFLDEIGEMSLDTQVKLLRFLESGMVQPVGATQSRRVDVRIIAATNRDLDSDLRNKTFREDLYYRLKVVPIHLPPLRHRKEDIPLLAKSMLAGLNIRTHRRITHITDVALEALCEYSWPGNIRELRNVLERAMIFSDTDAIDIHHLPEEIFKPPFSSVTNTSPSSDGIESLQQVERRHILRTLELCVGNKLQTARQLKIAPATLYRKLKEYGLE